MIKCESLVLAAG